MPRRYKRKTGARPRVVTWTKEAMTAALVDMEKKVMGVNEIARLYGIPSRTLRRHFKNNIIECKGLGKHPVLGYENEKRLVAHIKKLEAAGFPPDRQTIRMLAYNFAEKLQIKHNFNHDKEMAGYPWLQSFLERNSELSIRTAEGLSVLRAQSLNREEVDRFYELLTKVLTDNDLLDKPDRIYNMDETGVQLNNKPGKVIASKGKRAVHSVTSGEKGETMTVIGCCNAVGNFLPPVVVIKGVHKKPEFEEGLPPGSKLFMNKKSAYVNTELFHKWLTEQFIAFKPNGKVLLILDGHASHSSDVDMLQAAEENDVVLLCLPSHTTSVLQPLDRAVYKPFKTFFNYETNHFMRTNPQKKITRYNCGQLIGRAWLRAATPSNALGGFRGSGIFPLNPQAIPDSEFTIAESNPESNITSRNDEELAGPSCSFRNRTIRAISTNDRGSPSLLIPGGVIPSEDDDTDAEEATSITEMEMRTPIFTPEKRDRVTSLTTSPTKKAPTKANGSEKETPSKFLLDSSPIPNIPIPFTKRGKQGAEVLNSKIRIEEKKGKQRKGIPVKKNKKNKGNKENDVVGKENIQSTGSKRKAKISSAEKKILLKRKRKHTRIYSSSEDDNETNENICCVCLESYLVTKSKSDWIQCSMCKNWLHEECTLFRNNCQKCGDMQYLLSQK